MTKGALLGALMLFGGFSTMQQGYAAPMDDVNLLPAPQQVSLQEGTFRVSRDTRVFVPASLERPEFLAVQRFQKALKEAGGPDVLLDRMGLRDEDTAGHIVLSVKASPETDPLQKDGYRLEISPEGITLVGNSASGLFYGIQTLTQLAEQYGDALPAMEIEDAPDFEWRGFHHDVSRGRVPKLETLKWVVDYLADHKANMYQLYVEHPFMFRFDPRIAHNPDGLTPEEILELDQYCRDRRIEFVPSLQSFGHMAGVLSVPEYRELADVPMEQDWEDLTWNQRMKGATINTLDPDARELLAKMWDDYMPLFSADFVNASADETYDLGKGKGKQAAEEMGSGKLYLKHIQYLQELAQRYNKQLMIWGDIILDHENLVPEVPQDIIMLNWGYGRDTKRMEQSAEFGKTGHKFFVCPGTSGWHRVLNDILNAELNIRRFIEAGEKYGAMGVLNTDWGDHGHFNPLAGSLHGIALGASLAWNVEEPQQEGFDARWSARTFADHGRVLKSWKNLNESYEDVWNTWDLMYKSLHDTEAYAKLLEEKPEKAELFQERGRAMARLMESSRIGGERWVRQELRMSALWMELLGKKLELLQRIKENDGAKNTKLARDLEKFANETEELYAEYAALWRAGSKESDLSDIRDRVEDVVQSAREIAKEVR
jgi:hypothetical protein